MSTNHPSALQHQARDSPTSHRSGETPHLSWLESHHAAQAARLMPPPDARLHADGTSRSSALAQSHLRYGPESSAQYNSYPVQNEIDAFLEQNRTSAVSVNGTMRAELDPNRIIYIPPDPPNGGIDPADETDAQRESRELLEQSTRRIQDVMRTTELARAMMPPSQRVRSPARPNETINEYLDRQRVNQTLSYLDRQREFRERYAIVEQLRSGSTPASITVTASNAASTPNAAPAASNDVSSDPTGIVERSNNARRDLDRAIRQYRIARRELRSHHSNEPSSPGEQNSPSYQGVLAQLAEQSNNRNRMRARGQSRANALDHTDALVDSIANAAGIDDEAWRREDDLETVVGPSTMTSAQAPDGRDAPGPRSTLPTGVTPTSETFTGPTAATRYSASTTQTLSEFQSRMADYQQRRLNAGRPANQGVSILPAATNIQAENRLPPEGRGDQVHNQSVDRLNRSLTQLQPKANKASTTAKSRARKMIQYLTELRKCHDNPDRSLALTRAMGIESLAATLTKGSELDLPVHIDQMPRPHYSSWLEPGMSWEGIQKGGFGKPDSEFISSATGFGTGPLFERGTTLEDRVIALRAWRHRERIRSERQTRVDQTNSDVGNETRGMLRGLAESADTLADVERHLSDLLEEEERRLGRNGDDGWRLNLPNSQPRSGNTSTPAEKEELEDKWPVNVTLHEVNWEKMSVSGTMVASQVPDVPPSLAAPSDTVNDSSPRVRGHSEAQSSSVMETFFDGEIIDFRNHEMETVGHKDGYIVGGAITDLKYWSRIGPFKQEVKKKVRIAREKKASEAYEKHGITGTLDEQRAEYKRTFKEDHGLVEDMDIDDVRAVAYDTMADCMGSQKWMEKVMGEDGWVFMRWKERCFIESSSKTPSTSSASTPTPAEPNHARARTVISRGNSFAAIANRNRGQTFTTSYNDEAHHSHNAWGLTIRGFYYVALNRLSGRIEALYYDSGSQPFQELRCVPAGMGNYEDDLGLGVPIGIKKDFGVFEFR